MKKFAIIIVNYNCSKDTLETIESLTKFDENLFDIYLIDNSSQTTDLAYLEKNLSRNVFLIKSEKNLGFAGANNLAIKKTFEKNYQYYFLLNPDTLIEDNNFFSIIEKEIVNSNADILGPLVRYYPEKDKIYFAGGFVNRCIGFTQMKGKGLPVSIVEKDENSECDFITGCSMIIKKEVFDQIGLLPEEYFLYFEETDFCLNAKNRGFRIIFTPKTYIYHKVSSSISYMSDTYLFYMVRNFKIFGNKYVKPECRVLFYLFYYLVWCTGYSVLSFLINRNLKGIKQVIKGLR